MEARTSCSRSPPSRPVVCEGSEVFENLVEYLLFVVSVSSILTPETVRKNVDTPADRASRGRSPHAWPSRLPCEHRSRPVPARSQRPFVELRSLDTELRVEIAVSINDRLERVALDAQGSKRFLQGGPIVWRNSSSLAATPISSSVRRKEYRIPSWESAMVPSRSKITYSGNELTPPS